MYIGASSEESSWPSARSGVDEDEKARESSGEEVGAAEERHNQQRLPI